MDPGDTFLMRIAGKIIERCSKANQVKEDNTFMKNIVFIFTMLALVEVSNAKEQQFVKIADYDKHFSVYANFDKDEVLFQNANKVLIRLSYDQMDEGAALNDNRYYGKYAYFGDFNFDGQKDVELITNSDCLRGYGYRVYVRKGMRFVFDKALSVLADCNMFDVSSKHKQLSVYDTVTKKSSCYGYAEEKKIWEKVRCVR